MDTNKWRIGKIFSKKEEVKTPTADRSNSYGTANSYLFNYSYNGEKNLGEIGPIKNYRLDYQALRMRSWQAFHESEIAQTILKRFCTWVIGKGLKMQVEPVKLLLQSEGIDLNTQEFSKTIEARFSVWGNSKMSDYAGMKNLHMHAWDALKNTILGGDVLVVLRYEDGVTIQLIDGAHLQSPTYGSEWFPESLPNGNKIINGIETDSKGNHVRYYIRQKDFSIKPIEARGKSSNLQMAFLVYGLEYRLDNNRGVPLFSVVLETLKKLERYKEAAVGSAEERAKIIMQIVHEIGSTGENPQNKNMAKAYNWNASVDEDIPIDVNGVELANTITASTAKNTYNMPIGSELKSLDSKAEMQFKEFYETNADIVCATIEIPPNVAFSKYNDSFSASRAALKDWEHTLQVKRGNFAFQYYQPIYNFWLECEILNNKVQAPGYIAASLKQNNMLLEAYRTARFVGAPVPHIDPVKEVNAERLKLGTTGATIPLTTAEAAAEALGCGEFMHNMDQYADELAKSKELKIVEDKPDISPQPSNN